ncbi:MAG: YidC/Oxa1 family membrane protein insertase [Clostridiaceae bacterium]|nr:YidC/Oxa1 family membrane protein insertase [Clostridiaceae bacterium]
MQGLLAAIGLIFGKLMYFIYNTIGFHNYAFSLVLFTIAYKLILLPLSIKQMKSTQKMQEIQPELARLQARYKNDREKLNEETMKLYQEKGYNPTSGCLPLLIQLPILFALLFVIRMPMTYMMELPAKAIGEMAIEAVENGDLSYASIGKETYDKIKDNPMEVYSKFSSKDYSFEIKLIDVINKKPEIVENNPTLSENHKAVLKDFNLRMFNIFNLGIAPTYDIKAITREPQTYIPPLIILLLAVASTYFSTRLLTPPQPEQKGKNKAQNPGCASNSMLWISPLMTLWIGFTTPSGLSFYWTINNILSFIQQKALNNFVKKDNNESKEEKNFAKDDSKRSQKR